MKNGDFSYCVGFTDEDFEFFEIYLETPFLFLGKFEFVSLLVELLNSLLVPANLNRC